MVAPGRATGAVERNERIYRRLLVVYPRDFRAEYGDDMVQGFRDLMVFSGAERGVWRRTIRDLVSSAVKERGSSLGGREPSWGTWLVVGVVALAAFLAGPGPFLPLFLIPVVVLVGLPVFAAVSLRRAWVVHRSTGGPVARHILLGIGSLVVPVGALVWLGDDAGYWIFVSVGLTLIIGSAAGIVWGVISLVASRDRTPGRRRWVRPALVLVPSIVILGFIIGASYNSYRNSLGPPGDHSVANASADTRALWEAAGRGDLAAVMDLTATTCADPWVKFPTSGGGRHNAKGFAENRTLQVSGPLDDQLHSVADHLGDYMDVWYDDCVKRD